MFPFSDEELRKPVEKSMEKIRPILTADGGDVTLLSIKGPKVYVRLEGACKGCSASAGTLKNGLEKQLREDIHPDMEIINVLPGEDVP